MQKMTSRSNGGHIQPQNCSTSNNHPVTSNGTSSKRQVTTSNLDNNESTTPDQILCSQQCEALHKIASKLHQLENGQRKIIQLLLNLDKELTSKEKSGTTHCSKHSSYNNTKGWVREEDSGDGERLVKIQLQDATTSTKHVGFRIDKSCQTSIKDSTSSGDNTQPPQCEACRGYSQEMAHLQDELRQATEELSKGFEANVETATTTASNVVVGSSQVDFGSASPLNLFIQCFKEKYGLSVNPNDVAIFV